MLHMDLFGPSRTMILCGNLYANQKGVFPGYAIQSHVYRVYNNRLVTVEESMHVVFDETNLKLQDQVSKNVDEEDLL